MGRIVSCKSCGRWVEVGPGEKTRDYVCDQCRGVPGVATGRPGGAATGADVRPSPSRGPSLGTDSGEIGSTAAAAQTVLPSEGTAPGDLGATALPSIETSGADEARRRLEELVARMQPSGVCDPKDLGTRGAEALTAAGQGARWVTELASDLAVEEARKTTDEAAKLVHDKGLRAVGEVDDFLKRQGARVRDDALRMAEAEVKKGADRAARAVHKKLSTVRPGQVVQQTDAAGRCASCSEPIVAGDRVTVCPTCSRRYHAGCYAMTGCVSSLCRESSPPSKLASAAAPPPVARPADSGTVPISLVTESFPRPRRCTSCGAQVSRGSLVCPQCGRWLYSGRMSNDPRARQRSGAGSGCGSAVFVLAAVLSALAFWWFVGA